MSVSTGRMSRQDAQTILSAIRATLPEFSTPDATPTILQEVSALAASHGILQADLDRGRPHSAALIRDLCTRVAALSRAVCVTLYGIQDEHSLGRAAHLAANDLGLTSDQVRLQDRSDVRTATLTGTRYIFTSRTP